MEERKLRDVKAKVKNERKKNEFEQKEKIVLIIQKGTMINANIKYSHSRENVGE
jgi:hypothetical protein